MDSIHLSESKAVVMWPVPGPLCSHSARADRHQPRHLPPLCATIHPEGTAMNSDKPGLPDYTGPQQGWFAYIHHEQRLEWSDNIQERVAYIVMEKPAHEQAIRLACLTHIPTAQVPVAYATARQAYATAGQAQDTARQAYATAGQAIDAAGQAYGTAWRAYDAAGRAINTARQAYAADIAALVSELVPDAPWNGHELVFPPEQKEHTP